VGSRKYYIFKQLWKVDEQTIVKYNERFYSLINTRRVTNVKPVNQITSGTAECPVKKFSEDTLTYACIERFDWLLA